MDEDEDEAGGRCFGLLLDLKYNVGKQVSLYR